MAPSFASTLNQYITTRPGRIALYVAAAPGMRPVCHREQEIFPAASTIKLAVLVALYRNAEQGVLSLQDALPLRTDQQVGGDGILRDLVPGHRFTLQELARLMIVLSDNTAANMLIQLLGMDVINTLLQEKGLADTRLQRLMMDSAAAAAGRDNFTSARDMGRFFHLLLGGEMVSEQADQEILSILAGQRVQGRLERYLPSGIRLAHKTGDLDNLEHDVGVLWLEKERPLIVCVLCAELPDNASGQDTIAGIGQLLIRHCSGGKV